MVVRTEYKPVPDTDLTVSRDGKVKGPSGKILSQRVGTRGYMTITRNERSVAVHLLVLLAWVGPRPEGYEACHGDKGRLRNHVDNLRWDTRKANAADRVRSGRNGNWRRIPSPCRRVRRSDGAEWKTAACAGRELGLVATSIARVCRGVRKTYAGYGWSYVSEG